ncbi:MAG: site-2 protease family protein [Candidatus Aenigmarchaeota archaeon]|nr:site-2 protease family protein [Candidatus Aenigmarchaeota archaeon]
MKFNFTLSEVKEILVSAVVLSVAFAIAYSNGVFSLNVSSLPVLALFAFVAVGIGFLAHELIGHKLIAQRLGLHAQYHMWRLGLVIAMLSSLAGFVFAAPGAVYVSPKVDLWGRQAAVSRKRMGIVSISGPLVNLLLVGIFLPLSMFYPVSIMGVELFGLAVFVNLWLAIFNMLPIPPLDGSKVFAWDKRIWAALFAILIGLFLYIGI